MHLDADCPPADTLELVEAVEDGDALELEETVAGLAVVAVGAVGAAAGGAVDATTHRPS